MKSSSRQPLFAFLTGRVRVGFAVLVATLCAAAVRAQTPVSYSVLRSFAAAGTDFHNDGGYNTHGNLREGLDGNLYGTGYAGGANGTGTIFRLTPDGVSTTLHNFDATTSTYPSRLNSDGIGPSARLLATTDGSFYGTAYSGGANGYGTVFLLTPDGQFRTLYTFSASGTADGRNPLGGLIDGGDGNLYGVTQSGGSEGVGSVFRITPGGTIASVFSFSASSAVKYPTSLLRGRDGNFYGTVSYGSPSVFCSIFRLTRAGVMTVLHTFSDPQYVNFQYVNDDGLDLQPDLVQGADGAFYGTARTGGANAVGTIFRVTAAGDFRVLYTFPPYDDTKLNEVGAYPSAGLILAQDGNFYGVTAYGGGRNGGTVFRLTPAGAFSTVYGLGSQSTANREREGQAPTGLLTQSRDRSLYGSTLYGGDYKEGVIFKLVVHPVFFTGQTALGEGVYYLEFPSSGKVFGYYEFLGDPHYLYHFDLGFEYVFNSPKDDGGVYFYDFASQYYFYTSPTFPFPYLYDFGLRTFVYYFPDPTRPDHYNTDGKRYFVRLDTGRIFVK